MSKQLTPFVPLYFAFPKNPTVVNDFHRTADPRVFGSLLALVLFSYESPQIAFQEKEGIYKHMWRKGVLSLVTIAILTAAAVAQESRSEVSVQGTGFYTKDSNGQGIRQHGTDTGGFLVGYRYNLNRWFAAEANYGFVRNTQQYSVPLGFAGIQTNVNQYTGGIVFKVPSPVRFKVNPYLLAGGGALVFSPTDNNQITGADTQAKGAFVYGGGADFPLSRHFSLRGEYRGLVYKSPDFGLTALNTDAVTHTAQPSAGIVFRF
ncbi:MAG TPA: porin family protein [Terriglobales bacterium]|nr:porin family protein [Terriglobales bacterium]